MTIFKQWEPSSDAVFGYQPIRLEHHLAGHPLFTRQALAELIERYPEDRYMLVNTGQRGGPRKLWQQGKIGKMRGDAVIDAVENGCFWLNLLHANEIDPRYQQLLDEIYAEIHTNVPRHPTTYKRICGILISSPKAQVYYHFDTQGNNLWQIAGSKRVYMYPATPPFVTEELVEQITLYHDETSIPYQPWYDDYAKVFDLQAGQMLHWGLNAPHRIENNDELSVSLTTEYVTKEIRRHVLMTCGNGLLRERGLTPSRTMAGPTFYAKAALFAVAKKSGMLNAKARKRSPITFRLDANGPVASQASTVV